MKGFGENKNKNSNKSNLVKSDKDKFLKSQIDLLIFFLILLKIFHENEGIWRQ